MKKQKDSWEKLRIGYEEVQMVESSIEKAYPEAYRLARKFHNLYEEQAPFFGYITNANSREFYPNSNNGRLMAYVCFNIIESERQKLIKDEQDRILKEGWKMIEWYRNPENQWAGLIHANTSINAIQSILDKIREPMCGEFLEKELNPKS